MKIEGWWRDGDAWRFPRCIACGKELILYFNGGELDCKTCCGYKYEAVHGRIDLEITKEEANGNSNQPAP